MEVGMKKENLFEKNKQKKDHKNVYIEFGLKRVKNM